MALANTRGVTRWRRSAVIAVPAAAAVAGMAAAMLNGVLAANLAISNTDFTLKAAGVTTDHNGLSLVAQSIHRSTGTTSGTDKGVAEVGITQATLNNMCVAAHQTLPIVGAFDVKLTLPGTATTANNLILNADSLSAQSATLQGSSSNPIILGQDAAQVGNGITNGAAGAFGLVSGDSSSTSTLPGSTLGTLNANAQSATIGGSLSLTSGGLNISVAPSSATSGC